MSVNRHMQTCLRGKGAIVLLLAALSLPALSQHTSRLVEHVTDGFSGLCLVQDQRGFVWCGTGNGLFSYDGYSAAFLHHDEADTSTLSDEQVNALALADDGSLWAGTPVGLDRVNPVSRKVRRFSLPGADRAKGEQVYVTSILVDSGGMLWVGTQEHGLLQVTVAKTAEGDSLLVRRHAHRSDDPGSLSHNHVHALWTEGRGMGALMLVGTSSGLSRFDKATGVCRRYLHDPADPTSLPHDEIWAITGGDSQDVWLATGAGVCRLRLDRRGEARFMRLAGSVEGHVFTLARDHEGYLWFGSHGSGIVRYHLRTGRFQRQSIEQEFYGRRYINAVYSSLCDRQGAVWFGVHYGLERYDPARKPFEFIPLTPPPDRWLVNTTAFCEDDRGDIWIATDARGVFRCRAGTADTIQYRHDDADPGSLSADEVNTLLKDRSGNIWVGTTMGLDRYRPGTDLFEHFRVASPGPPGPRTLAGTCVYGLLEDRDGNLWVATNGGLSALDPVRGRFTHYLHRGEMAELGFYVGGLAQPAQWRDGSLLLGSRGLYRFHPATGRLTRYLRVEELDQMIFGIIQDRTGGLWASTFAGVYLVEAGGEVRHFSAPGQLPSNLVCQVAEDLERGVWVSTATAGVARYDSGSRSFRAFDVRGGFLKNNFHIRGSFRAKDGTIYLGAPNGFLRFLPSEIRDNPRVPTVSITGLRVVDRPITMEQSIERLPELILTHTENMVTFDFVGLCYTDAQKIQYAYRLEGLSDDWFHCGTQRTATFTNLDPGTYLFRVKASNSDGIWNEEGASLRLVIDPPFWQTWWFRVVVVAFLGAALYGAYRYRLGKVLALERLRLRIANDLHDDIGSDLSSLALESDLLARRFPAGDPASERLRTVGRTLRGAADNLRDVVWIVSPDQDRVQNLVERMREVAAKMLAGTQYEFRCTGTLLSGPLDIEFKRHVLMMFKEMLHNVVSHARASRVEVDFEIASGRLRLCVRDDGVGFDPSERHSGRGLRSLQARASAIGGRVTVESAPGRGTAVCVEADITRL